MTPEKIINMCMRGVIRDTPPGTLAYSYGFRILMDVQEYLQGTNSAIWGGVSWVAMWWRHYDGG